jgi:hypothetical protein
VEGPDVVEVRDAFTGREPIGTVEVAVAEELDAELTEPAGPEEELSTAWTKCMSANHCSTVIQARIVARGRSGADNHVSLIRTLANGLVRKRT